MRCLGLVAGTFSTARTFTDPVWYAGTRRQGPRRARCASSLRVRVFMRACPRVFVCSYPDRCVCGGGVAHASNSSAGKALEAVQELVRVPCPPRIYIPRTSSHTTTHTSDSDPGDRPRQHPVVLSSGLERVSVIMILVSSANQRPVFEPPGRFLQFPAPSLPQRNDCDLFEIHLRYSSVPATMIRSARPE